MVDIPRMTFAKHSKSTMVGVRRIAIKHLSMSPGVSGHTS